MEHTVLCGCVILFFSTLVQHAATAPGENNVFRAIEHMKPLVQLEEAVMMNARIYVREQTKVNVMAPVYS